MSRNLLRIGLLAAFLLVAATVLLAVRGYEQTLVDGRIVLFELAPVDPRSLMQGDYMALAFAVDRELEGSSGPALAAEKPPPPPRFAFLRLDAEGRASLAGVGKDIASPESGLVSVRIRARFNRPSIGPNAFFFQEGTAEQFEAARWGEFRVAADGKALLTHLRDAELHRLGEIER